MTRYRVLSWRDVPLQVKVRGEGGTVSAELDQWFTQHVDRLAMRDGLYGTDAYLEAMVWGPWQEREGTGDEVLAAVVVELEERWKDVRRRWQETGELADKP